VAAGVPFSQLPRFSLCLPITHSRREERRKPGRGPLILRTRCRQTGAPLVNAATAL